MSKSSNILTIGMACYKEYDNVWATLEALRTYHGNDFDIVVVDNAPDSCKRTRSTTNAVKGRYYHRPDLNGTSRPRDAVFQFSKTEWTMCIDSHVFLIPGAVDAVIGYIIDNPEDNNLHTGPIIGDDGEWVATEWSAPYLPGLWGHWTQNPEFLSKWKSNNRASVFDMAPWEIPMMGLGLWFMKTRAYPGFNKHFRGFGGEEGYLHEKVRQLGGKCYTHPKVGWRHKFRDVGGWGHTPIPYPTSSDSHVKNLVLGHRELGIDPQVIKDKYVVSEDAQKNKVMISDTMWASVTKEAEKLQPFGKINTTAPLSILGVWYTDNRAPEQLIRNSLRTISAAAEQSKYAVRLTASVQTFTPNIPIPQKVYEGDKTRCHQTILNQIKEAMGIAVGTYDIVCFLEHDVLYGPGYFDVIGDTFNDNPTAKAVSYQDYIGLNATGWQRKLKHQHPLHQQAMRYDIAVSNLERCETELKTSPSVFMEYPQGKDNILPPPDHFCPNVHVNHAEGRFTNHGDICYEPVSSIGHHHPFWGESKAWWPGGVMTGQRPGTAPLSPRKPQAGVIQISMPVGDNPLLASDTEGCIPCGKGAAVMNTKTPENLQEWFSVASSVPSDFHEHMYTLRDLASECYHVTQLGKWSKPSRIALAIGTKSVFLDISPHAPGEWNVLRTLMGANFQAQRFSPENLSWAPDKTDLLFLDLEHTANSVMHWLSKLQNRVSHYIVVHCTTHPYGDRGEDGGPGVMSGVRAFLHKFSRWTAIRHKHNNHGMIVLSCKEEDKHQPPGILSKMMSFGRAKVRDLTAGSPRVTEAVFQERMDICATCEYRYADTCGACGCPLEAKLTFATEQCGRAKLGLPVLWGVEKDPSRLEK